MSLRVWLPLTGHLNNQGLDDITVTNNGATVDNSGKLGKCYNFTSTYIEYDNPLPTTCTQFSICAWVNLISGYTANYGLHVVSFGTSYGRICVSKDGQAVRVLLNDGTTNYAGGSNALASSLTAGIWNHYVVTFDNGIVRIYINGQLDAERTATITYAKLTSAKARTGTYSTENSKGYANDLRIYDHALSPKEVKLLSQGLVCHYKLDDPAVQTMDNCYVYPTFDTSSSNGGWYHWGRTGHAGSYSQNTDPKFIFTPGQTYSHCVSNAATATGEYLCYQSPEFDGGYRSLCCIIKESNSLPITEDIAFPDWNANVSSGAPLHKWTSIISIGNGFYLCKVEGLQQSGSNDLVGIYVCPGYTIYITCAYLENNRTVCSDIFYNTDIVYDSSGYNNHGTTWAYDSNGSIEISSSTPRYSVSTFINSADNTTSTASGTRYIYGNCSLKAPNKLTVAFWDYPMGGYNDTTAQGQLSLTNYPIGNNAGADYQGGPLNHRDTGFDVNSADGTIHKRLSIIFTRNEWHHYAVTYDGRYARMYKDGAETSNVDMGSNVALGDMCGIVLGFSKAGGVWRSNKSKYSDFRLYATALSADDIKELYHTSASIDKDGNMFAYELKEV